MNSTPYIFGSLARISNLKDHPLQVQALNKERWASGDYVAAEITHPGSGTFIELTNGRLMSPLRGERVVGALGVRHATLESTGTWKEVADDGEMSLLTAAGLLGKLTSRSVFSPLPIRVKYLGHVLVDGKKATMRQYVKDLAPKAFRTPVILLVGTSMSAGKTTAGRIVTRQLKTMGKTVLAVKMTGAGRYRDILALQDAGADAILDFVDVGLPSTICPPEEFSSAIDQLLYRMALIPTDVAVVEIGASPYEPYNGALAIAHIRQQIALRLLCASDPYAVYGVMHGFELLPDLVTGPATNTIAGEELVQKLCQVKPLNLILPQNLPELEAMLKQRLSPRPGKTAVQQPTP